MDLAANSPEITTRPPAYAEDTVDSDILDGLADMTLLQNGTVRFDCKFTRPAVPPTSTGRRRKGPQTRTA